MGTTLQVIYCMKIHLRLRCCAGERVHNSACLGPTQQCSVSGLYDTLVYTGMRLCRLSEPLLRLLASLRWLVADSFNHLTHYLLATRLDTVLTSGRVSHLVSLLEEAVFSPAGRESDEIEQMEETLAAFRQYLPAPVRTVLGERFLPSTTTLLDLLQEPLLNKQLAYTLIDTLLVKLFPELRN